VPVHTEFRYCVSLSPSLLSFPHFRVHGALYRSHFLRRLIARIRVSRCFYIYRLRRSRRNEIRRLTGARLIISPHAIAVIPQDFMGVSVSADCYRQLHDARLIFNAIAGVETNNSRLLAFPCLCRVRSALAPPDTNGCSLFVSLFFLFFFFSSFLPQRGRDAGTLIEICNFQHES